MVFRDTVMTCLENIEPTIARYFVHEDIVYFDSPDKQDMASSTLLDPFDNSRALLSVVFYKNYMYKIMLTTDKMPLVKVANKLIRPIVHHIVSEVSILCLYNPALNNVFGDMKMILE